MLLCELHTGISGDKGNHWHREAAKQTRSIVGARAATVSLITKATDALKRDPEIGRAGALRKAMTPGKLGTLRYRW